MDQKSRATAEAHPWLGHYPEGVDWAAPLPAQSLTELFDAVVKEFGNHRFLDFMDKHYSYREVGRAVASLAEGLQKLGIGKGDHVGLFLPNTPYYVIAYFAILRTGATVVNFNPLYVERELIHQIEVDVGDIVRTTDPLRARRMAEAGRRRNDQFVLAGERIEHGSVEFERLLAVKHKNRAASAPAFEFDVDAAHLLGAALFRDGRH